MKLIADPQIKVLNVKLPAEDHDALKRLAKENKCTMTKVIRTLIAKAR